jgi:hypothetical protein
VAVYIGMLGLDFSATEPPELVAHLTTLAMRYAKAVSPRILEMDPTDGA